MPTTAPPPSQVLEGEVTLERDALPRLDHRVVRGSVAADAAGPGRYLVAEGDGQARLVPITRDVVLVGRSFTADLRLDDSAVSRRHAIIVSRRSGVRVLDDRSANGTFVNGRRVTEAELSDGDVLVVGGVVLTYREIRA